MRSRPRDLGPFGPFGPGTFVGYVRAVVGPASLRGRDGGSALPHLVRAVCFSRLSQAASPGRKVAHAGTFVPILHLKLPIPILSCTPALPKRKDADFTDAYSMSTKMIEVRGGEDTSRVVATAFFVARVTAKDPTGNISNNIYIRARKSFNLICEYISYFF